MMEHNEFIINTVEGLKAPAHQLASMLKIGDIVCLEGEMGVGKTTFTKYLVAALLEANDNAEEGHSHLISSPTFNIVHTYGIPNLAIWHFDLYRVQDTAELYELGLEQAMTSGISIIEWPHIAYPILPKNVTIVQMDFGHTETARTIKVFYPVL